MRNMIRVLHLRMNGNRLQLPIHKTRVATTAKYVISHHTQNKKLLCDDVLISILDHHSSLSRNLLFNYLDFVQVLPVG